MLGVALSVRLGLVVGVVVRVTVDRAACEHSSPSRLRNEIAHKRSIWGD